MEITIKINFKPEKIAEIRKEIQEHGGIEGVKKMLGQGVPEELAGFFQSCDVQISAPELE